MTLAAGARLGPYEILSAIGAGGMGEVYKARDTRLDRTVAVKVLPSHLSESPEVQKRFEREAKTISALSHPHICALYDVGSQDGVEYLVMEYLEGETLADLVSRGPLRAEHTMRYGIEIADALDRAHRQGIVHRDLKPGNVMLTKSGVKLLDFGLAKTIERTLDAAGRERVAGAQDPIAKIDLTALPTVGGSPALTEQGTILGTFQYMAPEQLEGKEADARTDIFALGAVLYEMATGGKAFSGATQASLIGAILHTEPAVISTIQPTSPAALDRIVKKCLAKDPEERWQSAADLASELRWISEGSQTGAPALVAAPRRKGRDRIAWAIAVLLFAAAAYLGVELLRLRSVRPPAIHSFLMPPEKTDFLLTGDNAAPPVLSPDGERVVFGAGGRLWVQSLWTGATAALKSTEGASFPFWSPDSRSIGFFADAKVKTVDASGGPVQVVCDAAFPRGGAWGRGGVIVFSPNFSGGLVRVSAGGGNPSPLTRVDEKRHTTHRWPFFLPDGKHVLYLAANHNDPRSEESGIYAVSVDGGEPVRVASGFGSPQYVPGWLLSARDGSLMATPFDASRLAVTGEPVRLAGDVNFDSGVWRGVFTASQNGLLAYQVASESLGGQLTWLDASGRSLATVGARSVTYAPRLSPDGRRCAVLEGDPNADLWIYELERGVRTRLTTNAQVMLNPVWSRDGSQILFANWEDGEFRLGIIPSDGSGKRKVLLSSKERLEPTDWSRDGRYVLVNRGNVGNADIWAVPIDKPEQAFPLVQTAFDETDGQFSPDGRWVAYYTAQGGRGEIFVTPFPRGGARWQVSSKGAEQPRWAPDGRQIYFVSLEGELMAAPVQERGADLEIQSAKPVFRVNLFTGPRTGPAYDISPDGNRFLVLSAGDANFSRVALVVNWWSELKK